MSKTSKQWTAGFFLLLVLFQSVIACNNGAGSNGSAAVTPYGPYGTGPYNPLCPTCTAGAGGMPLLTNVKSATGSERVLFGIDVLAMGSGGMMVNPMDPKGAVMYSGPVALAGTMRILDPSALCGAPPGDYYFQTVQPIMMSSLTLMGGTVIAQGPGGTVEMNILNGQFYNSYETVVAYSQNNRVGLNVVITRMSSPYGMGSCGQISTF